MAFYRTTRLMLSGVAFLSLAGSAFALDGADLLTKLNAAYSQQGGTIAATGIDIADTTVTLKGATFKPNGDGEPLKIGDVTLTGVEKQDDGGYYIEEAAFPNFNTTEDGVTLTAEDMSLGDVWVPADPKADGVDGMLIYQTRARRCGQGRQGRSRDLLDQRLQPQHDAAGRSIRLRLRRRTEGRQDRSQQG